MGKITDDNIQSIINSECDDVFAYLGIHQLDNNNKVVRVFIPQAEKVSVVDRQGNLIAPMNLLHDDGLYSVTVAGLESTGYLLAVTYHGKEFLEEDPYRFSSTVGDQDLFLFGEGTHEKAYDFLGAHLCSMDGVSGCRFTVWAPNAKRVSVVGDFNSWDGRRHMMRKHIPAGIWEIFIPGVDQGALYKFELKSPGGDLLPHKADPFGFYAQCPPDQASVVIRQDQYQWQDQEWNNKKYLWVQRDRPISIYEVHLGSWRRIPEDGNRYLTYRELADELVPYVKYMGFTHLQLMPISEFPFDGSWGYQPIGMFAPTSRFGTPDDFKYLVDICHQNEIAVLVDWVPGHFPTDTHGLGNFDGTALYEHSDSRQGFHPDWNTFIYNYGRKEVINYLMANALFWFDKFHIDGLRVDAVASMLYLDYSRNEGEWLPNAFGGRENLEAIDFLKHVNTRIYKNFPDAMMVAEESTAWPGVSKPVHYGGLGFGFKWNMGWMNDTLEYMSKEPIHRQYHHHDMTFSMYYAYSENFILPLSHDEVVHGKGSILDRMPGDAWQKFANLRAYYAFMWMHPGKKLLFMGSEFGQGPEWDHNNSLCWHQMEIDEHRGVQTLIKSLNELYVNRHEMYENDFDEQGFQWIEADDNHNSIFAFIRLSKDKSKQMIYIGNFTPVPRENYRIGVNTPGYYRELVNTDSHIYGGSNLGNEGGAHSRPVAWHYRDNSIEVTLPPLAALILELTHQ